MKQFVLLICTALTLSAADATGKWTGNLIVDAEPDQPRPAHLVLKQEGDKLTGTAGPNAAKQLTIQNGKAENGILTFDVLPDNGPAMKFTLKHEDDEIKGSITRERDGRTETVKLAVKRDKE